MLEWNKNPSSQKQLQVSRSFWRESEKRSIFAVVPTCIFWIIDACRVSSLRVPTQYICMFFSSIINTLNSISIKIYTYHCYIICMYHSLARHINISTRMLGWVSAHMLLCLLLSFALLWSSLLHSQWDRIHISFFCWSSNS